MTDDWKTLRVPVEAWEKAKEQKEENGRTWGEQIVRNESDGEGELQAPEGIATLREATEEELEMIRDQMDHLPERTADEVEGRLR